MEEKAPTVAQLPSAMTESGYNKGYGDDPERGGVGVTEVNENTDIEKIERVYRCVWVSGLDITSLIGTPTGNSISESYQASPQPEIISQKKHTNNTQLSGLSTFFAQRYGPMSGYRRL